MVFQVTLSHMIVFFLVFAVGFAASRLKYSIGCMDTANPRSLLTPNLFYVFIYDH